MKNLYAILRVLSLAIAILGVVIALTLRKAEAKLVESLRGFGDQLAQLYDRKPDSSPRTLMINGLELRVVTLSTKLDVKATLDRLQTVCHSVGKLDLPATVRQKLQDGGPPGAAESLGVLRADAGTEGFLACIDLDGAKDASGFLDRLRAFGETGNLKSLGQFRYALARRRGNLTNLLIFWTDADARLSAMFPTDGDAPGRDIAGVPRPEGATRALSAFEFGMPYGFAYYRIQGETKQAVQAKYQAQLHAQGWSATPLKSGMVLARSGDRAVLVGFAETSPQQVTVSISDLA